MATSDNEKPFDLSGNSSARDGFGYFAFHQYQGFWFYAKGIENVKDFQQNFKALDTDIVIATLPKAVSPHDLVPFADYKHVYPPGYNHLEHELDSPSRLTATHVPYPSLPESIRSCINCKVVYLCKNPKDNFISLWHFMNKLRAFPALQEDNGYRAPLSIEEALEFFCSGVSIFGPFWDHILGYWKESLENPHRGLFLKYEDLKKEPKTQARRLAEFMGYGFSTEDESRGVIEEILHLCSFQNLKDLDVNKNGNFTDRVKNIEFYRKGEVADWKNHLRLPMVERLDRLVNDKFQGSGLVFEN
ncbi:cytosolic sulfotransferase 15-like [Papaver somniferum]|uniref:cytosolic sulfotransferase 15-like n=1 Tax=Papaver somniferum TaxID=3469 RepID=UPI000E702BC7|nr:cytosolic sulfotransferase 15-like [Papaver somniferum]